MMMTTTKIMSTDEDEKMPTDDNDEKQCQLTMTKMMSTDDVKNDVN
jgi:hypothetical protein